jgi:acetyl-CoA carboxylase carboxyltransferase component
MDEMRADYEHQLDAKYAAARGFVDAVIHPEDTRQVLTTALRTCLHNSGPHFGPYVLPSNLGEDR